jgi:hypothetical protein
VLLRGAVIAGGERDPGQQRAPAPGGQTADQLSGGTRVIEGQAQQRLQDLLRRWRKGQRALLRPQAAVGEPVDGQAVDFDFRTNQNFTLKTRALVRADLDDFVACYNPADRHERTETEQFRAFSYEELVARDKASLDIFWLRDESLEDTGNQPAPELIAAEIVEDLQAALDQFAAIAASLGAADVTPA